MPNELKKGVCRICGCTWGDPCYNPLHGFCWWAMKRRPSAATARIRLSPTIR